LPVQEVSPTADSARLLSLGLGVAPAANTGSLLLDGGAIAASSYIDATYGASSAVSAASHGRLKYDESNQYFSISENTGAYRRVGDVTGPASSVDKRIVTFNGATGKLAQDAGCRFYGTSATDPSSPAPANGDMYFNTAIYELMVYDGNRAKWLSASQVTLMSGRSGSTLAGSYYRGMDGLAYGANIGHPVPKGTLVGLAWSKTSAAAATLEAVIGGSSIATLALGAGVLVGYDWTKNADFAEGLMQFRNLAAGATTTDVQITALIKRRV